MCNVYLFSLASGRSIHFCRTRSFQNCALHKNGAPEKFSIFGDERRHQEPVYLAEWYKPMRLIAERDAKVLQIPDICKHLGTFHKKNSISTRLIEHFIMHPASISSFHLCPKQRSGRYRQQDCIGLYRSAKQTGNLCLSSPHHNFTSCVEDPTKKRPEGRFLCPVT